MDKLEKMQNQTSFLYAIDKLIGNPTKKDILKMREWFDAYNAGAIKQSNPEEVYVMADCEAAIKIFDPSMDNSIVAPAFEDYENY